MVKRGVILKNEEFGSFMETGKGLWARDIINQLELRKLLLYWDKIDWPSNDLISGQSKIKEVVVLKKEGILKRTSYKTGGYHYFGEYGAEKLKASMQLQAFIKNNLSKREEWVISQPSEYLILPDQLGIDRKAIEISLYKCLPSPNPEVNIEEILDFKDKYSDALLEFRGVMDDLYLEVIMSKDIPRAKHRAIQKIEKSIKDVEMALRERRIRYFLDSFKVNLNLKNWAVGGFAGMGLGSSFGMPMIGSALGTLFASIDFKVDFLRSPKNIPDNLKAYAVLNKVNKKLK